MPFSASPWLPHLNRIGGKISFLLKSIRVNDTTTRYAGYFYNTKTKDWKLGNGNYSFVEDFRHNYESAKLYVKQATPSPGPKLTQKPSSQCQNTFHRL